MTTFVVRVQSFFELLDEQVVEMEHEQDGSLKTESFFDAKDIRYAIFGVLNLFDGQRFSTDLFQADAAMVQSLAFGGWLGRIHMLPPHQSELLAALRQPRVMSVPNWDRFVSDFLLEISYKNEIPSIRDLEPKELYSFVKKYAGSTYEAFKAFEFVLNASDWRKRLARMRSEGTWDVISSPRVDEKLYLSKEFTHLKDEIDKRRTRTPLNNFADAIALSLLHERVARFNAGRERVLPVYFDTTAHGGNEGFFRQIADSAGMTDRFKYWLGDKHLSVLKPASYFRFKGMFRPPDRLTTESARSPLLVSGGLRKLRDEIAEILNAKKVTANINIASVNVPLGELIESIEDLSFFRHIWESNLAEAQAQTILEELNLTVLADARFARGVENALDDTLRELSRNTEDYRWVSNLWSRLKTENLTLVEINDLERDFRLARFSLPSETLPWAGNILKLFSRAENEVEKRNAFHVVVEQCSRAVRGRPSAGDEVEYLRALSLASSLLWLVGMYDELAWLLEHQHPLPHHSFRIMYVAVLIRKQAATRLKSEQSALKSLSEVVIDQRLRELSADFFKAKEAKHRQLQGELAIGIGYLMFEFLLSLGFRAKWRDYSSIGVKLPRQKVERLLAGAGKFAQEAYDALLDRDLFKAMYALNQRLYYLVEGAEDSAVGEMRLLVRDLLRAKDANPELWQYTYDDTLARYEHRMAGLEPERREERLKEAFRLSELAVYGSNSEDRHMVTYRDSLRAELELS